MFKFESLVIDNDFIHTDGIWQADVVDVNTKELKIEATQDTVKTRTTTEGFSLTFSPRSILSSATGVLPVVQIVDSEGFQRSTAFNTTGFNFGRGQITVDNVQLRGGTIVGGDLDVQINRDLLVEYLVNTSESLSRSHSIGIDFSAVGMLGMNGLPSFGAPLSVNNLRQFGATLSTPPSVRNEHIESTHQTYSDAGIKTSGKVNVLGKTTQIKPELKNFDKIKVFDSSIINVIGENLTAAADLRTLYDSIKSRALEAKKSEKEAEIEAKEVVEEISEIKGIGEEVEQKTEKAKQVFTEKVKQKIAEKSTVAAVEATNADDEKLLELANQYLKYEEVRDIIFDYETQLSEAYKNAETQLESKTWNEKVVDFVNSLKEVYAEECENFKANPSKYVGDVAFDAAYFVGDAFTPGGWQNVADCYNGRTTLSEAVRNESIDLSIDVGLCLCGAKIVKGTGKCLVRPICKLYEKATQKTISRAEKLAEQRKVGNVGAYNELAKKNAPFNDCKDAHHILPQQTLKKLGLNTDDAPAIIMPHKLHELTMSYRGYKKDTVFENLLHEVESNIQDVVGILKKSGNYSNQIENNMRKAMNDYMNLHKDIFK